jgi:hypothetical protein
VSRLIEAAALGASYPLLFSNRLLDLAGGLLRRAFEFQAGRAGDFPGDFLGFSFYNVRGAASGIGGTSFHTLFGFY